MPTIWQLRRLWRCSSNNDDCVPVFQGDTVAFHDCSAGVVRVVRLADGAPVWHAPVHHTPLALDFGAPARLLIADATQLHEFSPEGRLSVQEMDLELSDDNQAWRVRLDAAAQRIYAITHYPNQSIWLGGLTLFDFAGRSGQVPGLICAAALPGASWFVGAGDGSAAVATFDVRVDGETRLHIAERHASGAASTGTAARHGFDDVMRGIMATGEDLVEIAFPDGRRVVTAHFAQIAIWTLEGTQV